MKQLIYCLALLCPFLSICQTITIKGNILNEEGNPVPAATITIKGTTNSTVANAKGEFTLSNSKATDSLIVSAIGYETITEPNNIRGLITVILKRKVTELDETIVMAYGTTSRRFNTGNISKVTAKEISSQPVSNPLASLHGRVPGLEITQNTGVPGGGFKIVIRGQNSLTQGNEPLFIVDGVPFLNGNTQFNQSANSAIGGLSPLNAIDPASIESIEILKDADATAIYGSRGANGVVLITTKKAKAGKTALSVSYRTGFSRATRTMDMLSLPQYLQMRREAFSNDGVAPTAANAPDLLSWDTTTSYDYKKLFTGGTAFNTEANISLSGGSSTTRFMFSLGYQKESTVFAKDLFGQRYTANLSLTHISLNKKFTINTVIGYTYNQSNLLRADLTYYSNIAPHFPLYDSLGNLNWKSGNLSLASLGLTNPMAQFRQKYNGSFATIMANTLVSYQLFEGLTAKVNLGLQKMNGSETTLFPREAIDPSSPQLASSFFSNSSIGSLLAEPQLEYQNRFRKIRYSVLLGSSIQQTSNIAATIIATNYTSDFLLSSPSAAGALRVSDTYSQYRYAAGFARLNLRYNESLIVNLSARRDGSSRFGPTNSYANFAAAGAAWIFSNQAFFKNKLPFISFGKLRTSFGTTGNDQIGDYKYLDTWTTSGFTYQGLSAIQPSRLFNPDYGWETNKKLELAIELGFLKDRILLSAAAFRNRSNNQLVNYALPIQTGFSAVQQNFNAVIQNQGIELSLLSKNIETEHFGWSTIFNFTSAQNKLISFPGIENTGYRTVFIVGQPLSVIKTYQFLGIDQTTGIYRFKDADSNGTMNVEDRISMVNTNPSFYGGIQNVFRYKNFELLVFFEFRKQMGKNYLATQSAFIPGFFYYNQPLVVLDRWQKPGDNAAVQRFVSSSSSPAYRPAQNFLSNSDAVYSDASYMRCKTLSLSYQLSEVACKKIKAQELAFFIQAQNLFTITNYIGADPENQNLYVLPPLKTWVLGFRLQL